MSKEAQKEESKRFSRRHETSEAHDEAHRRYEAKRVEKLESARNRSVIAADRTPKRQISRLDSRLGIGVGAKKERARLWAKIGL